MTHELSFTPLRERGLTEPVAFSSSASVDHLLWALAGVPHTILRGGIVLLALRAR
jgi:hypothetical protein